jgi:hypothetical protein
MAVFHERGSQRLDWMLLHNGPVTLYYRSDILGTDLAWLQEQGYHVEPFDCMSWLTIDALHDAVAVQLQFPDYYGRNLHAFNDCLSDLLIPEQSGCVLVFLRYDAFAARFPDVAWQVLDIIAVQARYFLLRGRRLLALVQSDDPRIAFAPIGACPVLWNSHERLDKQRGL